MKNFIQPSQKKKKSDIDLHKIDTFISRFNTAISKNEFELNTGLDRIPFLSDAEFKAAHAQAVKNGYNLQITDDNYQTVTYKLVKIK